MRILHGKVWTFDFQFILLKPWKESVDYRKEKFHKIHLWIQVWHLPYQWLSKETRFKFKNIFCNVVDVLIPESGSKKGRYLKILSKIDLDRPLLRGTKIKCSGMEVWVDFKYENMGIFCFYYGRVVHAERTCWEYAGDAKNGKLLRGNMESGLDQE